MDQNKCSRLAAKRFLAYIDQDNCSRLTVKMFLANICLLYTSDAADE